MNHNRKLHDHILTLRERVKAVKPLLPKDWRTRLAKIQPELVDAEQNKVNYLGNVITTRTVDKQITDNLERIAVDYLGELKKGLSKIGLLKKK